MRGLRNAAPFWLAISLVSILYPELSCPAAALDNPSPSEQAFVKGGTYRPIFKDNKGKINAVDVHGFYLDIYPVKKSEYLDFLTKNSKWRRSEVAELFVDEGYLKSWKEDLIPNGSPNEPVTEISWFAANAYCRNQGKRLPTVAEWEYAAQASESKADARDDNAYLQRILEWYQKPAGTQLREVGGWRNFWGIYDMHGLVWEWVSDFNTALVTGESRGDSEVERRLYCGGGASQVSEADRMNYVAFMRYAFRSSLDGRYTVWNLGFRCAKDSKDS